MAKCESQGVGHLATHPRDLCEWGPGGQREKAAALERIRHTSPMVTVMFLSAFRCTFIFKIENISASVVRIN